MLEALAYVLPQIEPPPSWPKERKADFGRLNRELQKFIVAHERQIVNEMRRAQNGAALHNPAAPMRDTSGVCAFAGDIDAKDQRTINLNVRLARSLHVYDSQGRVAAVLQESILISDVAGNFKALASTNSATSAFATRSDS